MQINRNIYVSSLLIEALAGEGINHFVLSPGSRNTPLTAAVAQNKKAKSFSIADERSAGFFATGLSRNLGKPVVLVCTSGTAAAEYLPAVIEAYYQEIPLIIITADRPAALRGTGANQTIYQHGIYTYYVSDSLDLDTPSLTIASMKSFGAAGRLALAAGMAPTKMPLHINMQFDKPLEPYSYTDTLAKDKEASLKKAFYSAFHKRILLRKPEPKISARLLRILNATEKKIIVAGPGSAINQIEADSIIGISEMFNAPVLADAFSGLRRRKYSGKVVTNHDLFIDKLCSAEGSNDLIIQIGRVPSSKSIEILYEYSHARHVIVSPNSEYHGFADHRGDIYAGTAEGFLRQLHKATVKQDTGAATFFQSVTKLEKQGSAAKEVVFGRHGFSEADISHTIINELPESETLFIANSMPPRDFDFAVQSYGDKLHVYHNRGASGIDGIFASAAGTAASSGKPLTIVIGDISFFYDVSSLQLLGRLKARVTIVLLNNGGGRIFDLLPIKNHPELLKKYFHLPPKVSFKKLAAAFEFGYIHCSGHIAFAKAFAKRTQGNLIIECKTDINHSVSIRKSVRAEFLAGKK